MPRAGKTRPSRTVVVGSFEAEIVSATFVPTSSSTVSAHEGDGEMALRLQTDRKGAAKWAILMNSAFLEGNAVGKPRAVIDVIPPRPPLGSPLNGVAKTLERKARKG